MTLMISGDSEFRYDIDYLEASVKMLSVYAFGTKKELIIALRRIRARADEMERKVKRAGYDYMTEAME